MDGHHDERVHVAAQDLVNLGGQGQQGDHQPEGHQPVAIPAAHFA